VHFSRIFIAYTCLSIGIEMRSSRSLIHVLMKSVLHKRQKRIRRTRYVEVVRCIFNYVYLNLLMPKTSASVSVAHRPD